MRTPILVLVLSIAAVACAPRPDPRVTAAQDFQRTAWELIERDQSQAKKLSSLTLGMTDQEVLNVAGPPTRRETLGSGEDRREIWTYAGELKQIGTLTFENGRLSQMQVN